MLGIGLGLGILGGAAAAPIILPSAIGAKAWWDPTLVTTSGGIITAWPDQTATGALMTSTGSPVAGSGLNGRTSVVLDGTDDYFLSTKLASDVIGTGAAWSVIGVLKTNGATTVASAAGTRYNDPQIIGDCSSAAAGFWGVPAARLNVFAYQFHTAAVSDPSVANITSGTTHYFIAKYDGTTLFVSVDGGAFDAGTAAGAPDNVTHALGMGRNYTGAGLLNAEIGDVAVWNRALSAGDVASMNAFLKNKYGL